MNKHDNMSDFYIHNSQHYETGLTRIGCSREQAQAYGKLFNEIRRSYRKTIDVTLDGCPDGITVCDVGMGLGHDLEYFCGRHPGKSFVGIELSEETISIARQRLSGRPFHNLSLTSSQIWFKENKYDVIINNCVFEHVDSPSQFSKQIREALKQGGRFVFAVPNHKYWIFWQWPFYLLSFPFRGKPKTHSVKLEEMLTVLDGAGLVLEKLSTYGVRPPQPFFCGVSSDTIKRIMTYQKELEGIFRRYKMERFLYLNLFEGCAGSEPRYLELPSDTTYQKNFYFSSKRLFFMFQIYVKYLFILPCYLVRKKLKGVNE